jgi:hypothetical protein
MNWILLFLPLAVVLLVGGCWLLRSLTSQSGNLPVTATWIEDLSVERYRPMGRLLGNEDLAFLRTQPGFVPQMAHRLRAARVRIFRDYLGQLERDFRQVSMALKLILVHSGDDRPDLASALLRQQMHFEFALAVARGRLMLYRCGFSGADVSDLVGSFDSMRTELQRLVPASADLQA